MNGNIADWLEWSKYVVKVIERHDAATFRLEAKIDAIDVKLADKIETVGNELKSKLGQGLGR